MSLSPRRQQESKGIHNPIDENAHAIKHAPARRIASPSKTTTVADGFALSSIWDRHGYKKFLERDTIIIIYVETVSYI